MMIVQKLYFLKNVSNFMGLITKYNLIGNCVLCISGNDGLLGITFIFAKMGSIGTLLSLAFWLLFLKKLKSVKGVLTGRAVRFCSNLLCHKHDPALFTKDWAFVLCSIVTLPDQVWWHLFVKV